MSFLSNPRSAKLRNTYMNGFLDCSGDVVLRAGNVIIGNISQPGYNANQQSLLIHGRTQMNGNVIVNGNLLVSSNNIALGLRAGNIVNGIQDGVPNGLNSTAVGSFSGMNHTGQNNTFTGSVAGQTSSTTYFSRTGNNNTYLGYRTSANNSAWADSTAVGTGAVITASNQIVLGTTAETVSIPGKIYASNLASSYNSVNGSGSASWVRVGVFSAPQGGNICVIKIYGNQGYNATIDQNFIATIYFKTSNSISVNATGFAADSHYYIESSSITASAFIVGDPIWIANAAGLSATTYTLFLNLPAFSSGTNYTVNISPNGSCSWVDSYSFGTAPASQTSSSTCLLSTSSYGIKGNSIAIGLGALTTTSNQIVLGTTAYTVTVPRNLGLVSTTVVSYTQTSSLGFGYGGGTPNGTPYRWKIDDVTLNRDNGAGPFYDYGVQSSLYFRRKTNNLYSGGANDTTYTDSLILNGDGSATINGTLNIGGLTRLNGGSQFDRIDINGAAVTPTNAFYGGHITISGVSDINQTIPAATGITSRITLESNSIAVQTITSSGSSFYGCGYNNTASLKLRTGGVITLQSNDYNWFVLSDTCLIAGGRTHIMRFANGTQTTTTGIDAIVKFQNTVTGYGDSSYTGLDYTSSGVNEGRFTNNRGCSILVTASFNINCTNNGSGVRTIWFNHSVLSRLGQWYSTPVAGVVGGASTTSTFLLKSGEYFECLFWQNSGSTLTILNDFNAKTIISIFINDTC